MALVKVSSPSFSVHPKLVEEIQCFFPRAVLNQAGQRFDKAGLVQYLQGAEGAIVGLEPVDEEVLKQLPDLKVIAKYGVGLDNIDLVACKKRGIAIGWTGGVNRLSVTEMTLGFMIALLRNLYSTSLQLKQGDWNKSGGVNLSGKTVGIIGLGHIGKELVRMLAPFGCEILANDIISQPDFCHDHGVREVSKEELIRRAQIITIHTPLTDLTRNLFNADTFAQMRQDAVLINTARGGLVDEEALYQALLNHQIAGAASDVYLVEPPPTEGLISLNNFFCTPHIGGNSQESVYAMGHSAIEHLKKFFQSAG